MKDAPEATPIWLVQQTDFDAWSVGQPAQTRSWLNSIDFKGQTGRLEIIPDTEGKISAVVLGVSRDPNKEPFPLGSVPSSVPVGIYRLAGHPETRTTSLLALGWALGMYQFDRYAKANGQSDGRRLVLPDDCDGTALSRMAESIFLTRDLVNTPANDMGPAELEGVAQQLAERHGAKLHVTIGDDLLTQNFPLIHAVGRASNRSPRLIDLVWGNQDAPKVTLVGKGVCFDTGGLNLKPGNYMDLMKKDMGGAAHVLGLAQMIMSARLDVRLRVLVPAVENAVAGNAFRPGDVYPSRKGPSVEIGNTDAEGRLILADALALADDEEPDILIDMATLTGAARTALGPELPPFYTDDDDFAEALGRYAKLELDPVWRMPLWSGYESWIKSKIADVNHIANSPMAGSITAALFLKRFVTQAKCWAHFDIFAWNTKARPGQAVGGEAQAIRGLFRLISERYPES